MGMIGCWLMNNIDKFNDFDITCNKCNSKDVDVYIYMGGEVEFVCKECSNKERHY